MLNEYDPKNIEAKWQVYWAEKSIYEAKDDSQKPKWYSLMEFPYPSGEGLHAGHVRGYTAMDIVSRKRRMQGFNVLYPIGWDAFGLPAENYAIKTGIQPAVITKQNIETFRNQFTRLGMSFDWDREVNTTDPEYYKWTQWLFLKFLEHDLAYKAKMNINWCPKDKIGLANEEVVDGKCERCGTPVEKREKEQWMLRITKYADKLDKDLDTVDYPERVKTQQRNWIGRSEGVLIKFDDIEVFTTRPDTILGVTFIAVAPEVARKLMGKDFDITADTDREHKEKLGAYTGLQVKNPANGESVPVWVVNYVSPDYGTGAIMGVPSDDERDREFAEKYKLPIIENYKKGKFEDFGTKITKFKLRDWIFSRQRYWGEPIPVVHCEKCALRDPSGQGIVPVSEKDLPVTLPDVTMYKPTDTGESPLAAIDSWVNTTCPQCGSDAKRETDTMPNWAGSSWYFLRYTDPRNAKAFASEHALKHWMQVDWYNGGMEHTTLHLLYSRFWNKFLFDIGVVPVSEPYKKRTSHGMVLAADGQKMSKSKGIGVNPIDVIEQFGADTIRVYEMFMGPFEQAIRWSESSIVGPRRFIERVWKLKDKVSLDAVVSPEGERQKNELIKKVSEDIELMGFNTAISSLMVYANTLEKEEIITEEEYKTLVLLLAPFAPHVTEELWSLLGEKGSVHEALWPMFDPEKLQKTLYNMAVQVNGKLRATLKVSASLNEEEVKAACLELADVKKWLNGAIPKKVVVVLGKIVNIVV